MSAIGIVVVLCVAYLAMRSVHATPPSSFGGLASPSAQNEKSPLLLSGENVSVSKGDDGHYTMIFRGDETSTVLLFDPHTSEFTIVSNGNVLRLKPRESEFGVVGYGNVALVNSNKPGEMVVTIPRHGVVVHRRKDDEIRSLLK